MQKPSHDMSIDAYLNSSYEKFKEYERYQFLIEHMKSAMESASSLLDIGCAKGELLYLLRQIYPNVAYAGIDYSQKLVNLAKEEQSLEGVLFQQGDAADFDLGRQYDVTVMSGVLSLFDDIEKPLGAMLRHTRPGGTGIIFGGFVRADIDVLVKFRNNAVNSEDWESGWNMFSIESVRRALYDRVSDFSTIPFEFKGIIERDIKNPVRSYTVKTAEGSNLMVTGGNIIRDFHVLIFKKR